MKRALLAVPLALALSACGGGSSGRDVIRDASASLVKIRSGVLHAKLLVRPRGGGQPYGFTLDGPFRLGDQPTANITYVRIANGRRRSERLAATPEELRQMTRTVRGFAAIVDVSGWVKSSETTDCPAADRPVNCVKGELDPLEAANGVLALAQAVGTPSGNPTIQNADPEQVRKAVRKATYFVMAGKGDKLLRDLRIDLELAADVPEALRGFLGTLIRADVRFELAVDRPRT